MPTAHYADTQGRRITVIGLKHHASAEFWANLQLDLDALSRETVIHFEKPIVDRAAWSRLTRIKAAIGTRVDKCTRTVSTNGGLRHQFDSSEIGEGWENHDTSLSRILGATSLGLLLGIAGILVVVTAHPKFARLFGRNFVRGMVAKAGENQSIRALVKTSVVLDERNAIAAEAALASNSDVVMLWGHAHLNGIGAILEERGFRLERVSWRILLMVGG